MLFLRYVFAEYSTTLISSDFTDFLGIAPAEGSCRTTEWLRGEQLCTFNGRYHLAWSVPMYDPTYWSPSAAIHSFLMFGPFFIMKRNMIIQGKRNFVILVICSQRNLFQGVFLWLAGPYLASWITDNLMEQASIWCFFSIAQIAIMLFIIRDQLILSFGKKDSNAPQNTNGKNKKSQKTK